MTMTKLRPIYFDYRFTPICFNLPRPFILITDLPSFILIRFINSSFNNRLTSIVHVVSINKYSMHF